MTAARSQMYLMSAPLYPSSRRASASRSTSSETGRFARWIGQRGHEGLHHICYEVDDIDAALAHAQAQGATLRICQSCQKYGSHPHPEGWVAFLDDDAGGIEIEFMQVYTPEELEKYNAFKGI